MPALSIHFLDAETPRASLALLLRHFSELPDEREPCAGAPTPANPAAPAIALGII